ncbi:MAG: type II secretion system F family protein [Aeromicrobium sp.]|nr:type II secretion system F family protein [Burkholderiales bacterium]
MPMYHYRGRNAELAMVTGTLDAESQAEVVRELGAQRIVPIEITSSRPTPEKIVKPPAWQNLLSPKISDTDLILFTRQMYTLQRTAVPILRALAGLRASTSNPALAAVIAELQSDLDEGRNLSAALSRHSRVFSPFYVSMVRVGEVSGQMSEVFNRLFIHLEFEKDIREQIRSAVRYPMFVIIAALLGIAVLNMFVIPVFADVFAGFNAKLPLPTRLLIGFSNWTVRWWPLLAVGLVAGIFGIRHGLNTVGGRTWWDERKIRLPIVGDIIQKATLAKFARSFALASQSGIPVLQALAVVSQTVDNAFISAKIDNMREAIERGESLSQSAAATGVFTPVVLQMIVVGEEAGEIDSLLLEVAGMYERETGYSIKGLATKIEPLILLLLGVLVLVLALGIFLPMWSLGQAAMGRG